MGDVKLEHHGKGKKVRVKDVSAACILRLPGNFRLLPSCISLSSLLFLVFQWIVGCK
jgi:hypothetical protein